MAATNREKRKLAVKNRNPIAKAVTRIPNQVIQSKKIYSRKKKHKDARD